MTWVPINCALTDPATAWLGLVACFLLALLVAGGLANLIARLVRRNDG